MPSYTELADTAKDRVISAISQVQDLTVSAVESASKAVGRLIPSLPALPLADQVPAPKDVVETTFSFVEDLIDSQKKYALAVLDALTPITDKVAPNAKAGKAKSRAKAATAA